jgi:hypothetical protein
VKCVWRSGSDLQQSNQSNIWNMRFQVLTAASKKIKASWDTAMCSLVEVDRRFRGTYCIHHQGDKSVYINETTRHYIPEDWHLEWLKRQRKSPQATRYQSQDLNAGSLRYMTGVVMITNDTVSGWNKATVCTDLPSAVQIASAWVGERCNKQGAEVTCPSTHTSTAIQVLRPPLPPANHRLNFSN